MRIIVRDGDTNLTLHFPTGLILNSFTGMLAPKFLKQYGLTVTRQQTTAFIRALNDYKRHHRGWKLVEVESAEGEYVEIKI